MDSIGGSWVPVRTDLFRHPKTLALADALGVDVDTAAVAVIKLWMWSTSTAKGPEGWLSGISARALAYGAEWPGDPAELLTALVSAGFLDQYPDGRLAIHNWHKGYGLLLIKRANNRRRTQEWAQRQLQPALPTLEEQPLDNGSATVHYPAQNRTEHDRTVHDTHASPDGLASEPRRGSKGVGRTTPKNAEQFMALVRVFGYELTKITTGERSQLNKCARDLDAFTGAEIELMYRQWPRLFRDATCTPMALTKYAGRLHALAGQPVGGTDEQQNEHYSEGADYVYRVN